MPVVLDDDGRIVAPDVGLDGPVPTAQPLPELADMLALDKADLLEVLSRFDIVDPAEALRADVMGYLSRFPRLAEDPERMAAEVERLLSLEERRGLLGITRRTQERYTTLQAVQGDEAQLLIRISEGDTHVCEDCAALEGAIGTYSEHAAIGLPGAQTCLGGDYCRCQLVAVRDA
jgi:hypothetical protein